MPEYPISLVSRWTKNRMSSRSGYYAGRGVSTSDLNSQLLEMIFDGIKTDVSVEAAENFVGLIERLDDLSASAFLVAMEVFLAGGCIDNGRKQRKEDGIQVSSPGEAWPMILDALSGHGRGTSQDQTSRQSAYLKRDFLQAHDRKSLEQVRTGRRMNVYGLDEDW